MNRLSRLSFLIGCLLFGALISAKADASKRLVIERIIAVVNGDIILWSEWQQRVALFKARLGKTLDEDETKKRLKMLKKQVLDKMIEDKLLEQKAKKMQVNISDKEVNAAMKDTRSKHNLTQSQFAEALREQGYTISSYRAMVRRELQKLRMLQRTLRQKVSVSREEVIKYYKDMTRGMKPGPTEYRVRQLMLMFPDKAPPKVVASFEKKAKELLAKAKAKANLAAFVKMIEKHSNGPWKEKKGDLGYLGTDSLPLAISKIAKKLTLNKIYPALIRSKLGFHIVYLQGRRDSGVMTLKESYSKIKRKLQQVGFQREYKRYVKELRRKAVIDIRLKSYKS